MALFMPWQMQMMGQPMQLKRPMRMMVPAGQMPLFAIPTGAFPVPESISPAEMPPAVKASIMRNLEGPPKPAVTPHIMNNTQLSMIAPDLPWKADVKGFISG